MNNQKILNLIKIAGKNYFNTSHVEDNLSDTVITDPAALAEIRDEIEKKTNASKWLKHPVLTGIPTLGIGPAIARSKAVDRISRNILRKYPDVHKGYRKKLRREKREEREEQENYLKELEQTKGERNISAASDALNSLIYTLKHKEND